MPGQLKVLKNLNEVALKTISIFGSTFSTTNMNTNTQRSSLTNGHLEDILKTPTSYLNRKYDKNCNMSFNLQGD